MRILVVLSYLLLTACTDHKKEIAEQRRKIYVQKMNLYREFNRISDSGRSLVRTTLNLGPYIKNISSLDSSVLIDQEFQKQYPEMFNKQLLIITEIHDLEHKYDSLGQEYDKY